jgi:formate dehydrogenase assembly factor FdhD
MAHRAADERPRQPRKGGDIHKHRETNPAHVQVFDPLEGSRREWQIVRDVANHLNQMYIRTLIKIMDEAASLTLDQHVLVVSGRSSFEIMQKAQAARAPVVTAMSAPSRLAVEFAQESGQPLIKFL